MITTSIFTVYSQDMLPNSTVKPSSLMKYMQQAARENSDRMGLTYEFMRKHSQVFVLTKIKFFIMRPISCDEKLSVKTWPRETRGVQFVRDFEITDESGKTVVKASSFWIIIDFEKRTPLRPSALCADHPFTPEKDIGFVPERRIESDTQSVTCAQRKIYLSYLDENIHLNNTFYADIIMDSMDFDFMNTYISELQIDFKDEALLGNILEIKKSYASDNSVFICADNKTKGSVCFNALVKTTQI